MAPVKHIVIAGGGTAGWMSAVFLSNLLGPDKLKITLVESAEIGTVGVGEATIPPIQFFNQAAGINEAEFMKATQATFKLGIEFVDWTCRGERYMHPFGQAGQPIRGVSFHAYWLRARKLGYPHPLADFWMSEVAAYAGRFDRPSPDKRSPKHTMAYAYHFDAGLYAKYLRGISETRGVERIEGTIADVALDDEDGTISHLMLADGRHIDGDFFIDCTGFRALLIGALGQTFESWAHWLPADRAVAVPSRLSGAPLPYTQATALEAGWQWRINLQHRAGNGYVYASTYIDDDKAAATLLQNLDGEALADPRILKFTTGRRVGRHKNCLAVGLSSGFLEPLESTSIHFIQHALIKFSATFPLGPIDEAATALYNRMMTEEMTQVRDFLIFHYHANSRHGEPLWDHVRNMAIPDSLSEKITLFRQRGMAIFPGQTLFQEPNWLAIMLGQGVLPEGYDPLAEGVDASEMLKGLENIRKGYTTAAQAMPMHADVLAAYCKSVAEESTLCNR